MDCALLPVFPGCQYEKVGIRGDGVGAPGATGQNRTDDLLVTNQLHCRLCYGGIERAPWTELPPCPALLVFPSRQQQRKEVRECSFFASLAQVAGFEPARAFSACSTNLHICLDFSRLCCFCCFAVMLLLLYSIFAVFTTHGAGFRSTIRCLRFQLFARGNLGSFSCGLPVLSADNLDTLVQTQEFRHDISPTYH